MPSVIASIIRPGRGSNMMSRRKIEEKIIKKQQEIQELDLQMREAKAYIQALQDVAKMLPKDGDGLRETSDVSPVSADSMRQGSYVSDAREAILAAGKPLHVVQILKASGRPNDRKNRIGMAGSLSAYVRRNEIFTRPKPNTFGLTETGGGKGDSPRPAPSATAGPPDDFGIDPSDEATSH
jgi:hypothetical protein